MTRLQPERARPAASHPVRARGADSRVQHPGGGPARQHRPVALPLAAVEPPEAAVERAAVQRVATRTRSRWTRARPIPAARPAAASRTCRTSASPSRATSATWTRTAPCRTSIARTVSAAASCTSSPAGGFLRGVRVSGFVQAQSGLPYSIFSAEPEIADGCAATAVSRLGSGGLYRAAFGRPSLCGTLDELQQAGRTTSGRARSTTARSARRSHWPAAIRTTSASATSAATCSAASGSGASTWASSKTFTIRPHERRAPLGHLQRVQHGQLRAAEQRHRRRRHRLRPDHRDPWAARG